MKVKKEAKGKKTPMEKLTSGYEEFIKGKKVNKKGKNLFEKTLKKAVKPRGLK
jgi:hypothetical protein